MPEETLDGPALKAHFARAGFSARELVALSGAHTIGGKGFGEPLKFDNTYFVTLLRAPWDEPGNGEASHIGLESDHNLTADADCKRWVQAYAADEKLWKDDFSAAYVKMGVQGAAWAAGVVPPVPETRE